jgi:hypothetical protein
LFFKRSAMRESMDRLFMDKNDRFATRLLL